MELLQGAGAASRQRENFRRLRSEMGGGASARAAAAVLGLTGALRDNGQR
jgi:hypothetical protein